MYRPSVLNIIVILRYFHIAILYTASDQRILQDVVIRYRSRFLNNGTPVNPRSSPLALLNFTARGPEIELGDIKRSTPRPPAE